MVLGTVILYSVYWFTYNIYCEDNLWLHSLCTITLIEHCLVAHLCEEEACNTLLFWVTEHVCHLDREIGQ